MNKPQVQKQKKKMIGVISTILLLSLAVLAATQMTHQLTFAQGNDSEMSNDQSMMKMSSSSVGASLPQPNANGTILKGKQVKPYLNQGLV
jgi:hypothetical protein